MPTQKKKGVAGEKKKNLVIVESADETSINVKKNVVASALR